MTTEELPAMDNQKIMEAADEAERFMERVKDYESGVLQGRLYDGVKIAAIRRASMDLTRALARMRNNG